MWCYMFDHLLNFCVGKCHEVSWCSFPFHTSFKMVSQVNTKITNLYGQSFSTFLSSEMGKMTRAACIKLLDSLKALLVNFSRFLFLLTIKLVLSEEYIQQQGSDESNEEVHVSNIVWIISFINIRHVYQRCCSKTICCKVPDKYRQKLVVFIATPSGCKTKSFIQTWREESWL